MNALRPRIRASSRGHPAMMPSIRASSRTAPSPGDDEYGRHGVPPPLPFDHVDEMVKRFYKKNMNWAAPPMLKRKHNQYYSPTRMPAHSFQHTADAASLQRQAEVHLNVAALLSAFAFAATAAEGGLPSVSPPSTIDQAIFILLSLATLLLLGTVLHFLYIDMGLGTQGGRRYYYAYSSKLGNSCVSFHVGTFMLAACFPLWAYRRFGMQPAFYVTLAFAVLWVIYDAALLLPTHDHINQLLAHAYMGIDAEKAGLAGTQGWTPEAWEGMYKRPKPDEDPAAAGRNGAACTTTVVSAAAAVM